MKNYIFLLILFSVTISCSKSKEEGMVDPLEMQNDSTTESEIDTYKIGNFVSAPGENVMGMARISETSSTATLILENFSVNNGPDLHVYLAADLKAKSFIDLGKLQSNSGTQRYTINGTVNFNTYKYALIHCQQYNVLFGSALLK